MKMSLIISVLAISLFLVFCGDTDECKKDEQRCSGTQIQTCTADGVWGQAQDCANEGQKCMTMDSGMQHCM